MSAPENKAVFLSYASQDAEVARRICDALRAAGVEVWFDQSELRGGDVWDQKIRKQIKECALFVPIISANTQARAEGYFRLEWKLADRRTDLIGKSKAFLLPVCLDDTRDSEADVPDSFLAVQWMSLRPAQGSTEEKTLAAFCARVSALLSSTTAPREMVAGDADPSPAAQRPATTRRGARPASGQKLPRFVAALAFAVVVLVVVVVLIFSRRRSESPTVSSPTGTAPRPAAPDNEAPAPSAAQKLLARLWSIYDLQQDGTQEEWALAEELGAQALKLEPANADVAAAYAQATWGMYKFFRMRTYDQALSRAEKARALGPDSFEGRFAVANMYREQQETRRQAEEMLRELLAQRPDDKRVLRVLAYTVRGLQRPTSPEFAEALSFLERAASLPGGDASASVGATGMLWSAGRPVEALASIERALAVRKSAGALAQKIQYLHFVCGQSKEAANLLEGAPAAFWRQDDNVLLASEIFLALGQPARAITVLRFLRDDYSTYPVESPGPLGMIGPKNLFLGLAHQVAGSTTAAQTEWRLALQNVQQRLTVSPNARGLLYWQTWLLAALGEQVEARRSFELWREYAGRTRPAFDVGRHFLVQYDETAGLHLQVGERAAVLDALERAVDNLVHNKQPEIAAALRNRLRYQPVWRSLQGDPRFEAALVQLGEFAQTSPVVPKGGPP